MGARKREINRWRETMRGEGKSGGWRRITEARQVSDTLGQE